MFKSATGLDSDDFLAIFKFLNTGPHCENAMFYDSQAKRELKKYTRNVKPGMKAKVSATDLFFMHLKWFGNGFTITVISWLFNTPNSSVSRYHMDKFTVFLWEYCYMVKLKSSIKNKA